MTPTEARQVAADLRAARALIDTPEKWTQGAFAREAGGKAACAPTPRAVCWCLVGAIYAAVNARGSGSLKRFYMAAKAANVSIYSIIGTGGIMTWNDAPERTHAEVLDALDRAIAAADADAEREPQT